MDKDKNVSSELSTEFFLLAQLMGGIGCIIAYLRMQQDNWRKLHIYHTFLCIPLGLHYLALGAFFAASLCAIGGIRTLFLSTDWGIARKVQVVAICLMIPAAGMFWTATHWLDWILLATTLLAVGSEAQSCMKRLRYASLANALAWAANALAFGAIMGALLCLSSTFSNLKALRSQFGLTLWPRMFLRPSPSRIS